MTRRALVLSLSAERDLAELFDYIAGDSGVDRAEAVLRRLEVTMSRLAEQPRIGRIRIDLDGSPRVFSLWPWLVIYDALADRRGIVVWRVVDGRRNLSEILGAR